MHDRASLRTYFFLLQFVLPTFCCFTFLLVPASPFVRLFSHSSLLHCETGMCIFRFAMKIIITQFSYLYEKWLFLDHFAVRIALSFSLSLVSGAAQRCTRAFAAFFGGFLQSSARSLPLRFHCMSLDALTFSSQINMCPQISIKCKFLPHKDRKRKKCVRMKSLMT